MKNFVQCMSVLIGLALCFAMQLQGGYVRTPYSTSYPSSYTTTRTGTTYQQPTTTTYPRTTTTTYQPRTTTTYSRTSTSYVPSFRQTATATAALAAPVPATRKVIPVGQINLKGLGALLPTTQQGSLFYLSDTANTPLVPSSFNLAAGSRSVPIPFNSTDPNIQSILSSKMVEVKELQGGWIDQYLQIVFQRRSTGLDATSMTNFNTLWGQLMPAYRTALQKIWHYIELDEATAKALNITTTRTADGKAVTFLFMDDPFPPHTKPATALTAYVDLLKQFIQNYGFNAP